MEKETSKLYKSVEKELKTELLEKVDKFIYDLEKIFGLCTGKNYKDRMQKLSEYLGDGLKKYSDPESGKSLSYYIDREEIIKITQFIPLHIENAIQEFASKVHRDMETRKEMEDWRNRYLKIEKELFELRDQNYKLRIEKEKREKQSEDQDNGLGIITMFSGKPWWKIKKHGPEHLPLDGGQR